MIKTWFCNHNWKTVERTFAGPKFSSNDFKSLKIYDWDAARQIQMVLSGLTIIREECVKCNKRRNIEMIGTSEQNDTDE